MASPVKVSYQGVVVSDKFVWVHFNVGNGSWMRHQRVAVPLTEMLTDEFTQALDRHVRRRLVEIWSEQRIPDLFDEDAPWED